MTIGSIYDQIIALDVRAASTPAKSLASSALRRFSMD